LLISAVYVRSRALEAQLPVGPVLAVLAVVWAPWWALVGDFLSSLRTLSPASDQAP
jgi:hypothetical protein